MYSSSTEYEGFSKIARLFRDISERSNDYSDTIEFRRGRVREVEVVSFFVLEVPDSKSWMLIYEGCSKSNEKNDVQVENFI